MNDVINTLVETCLLNFEKRDLQFDLDDVKINYKIDKLMSMYSKKIIQHLCTD